MKDGCYEILIDGTSSIRSPILVKVWSASVV